MKNEISIKDIVLATPKNVDLVQLAEALESKPTELRLPIKATSNGDKYSYAVLLRKDNYGTGKIVLRLEGTPGQWYLETLLNRESRGDRDYIAIDFGQNWIWTNPNEVLEVAKEYVDQLKEADDAEEPVAKWPPVSGKAPEPPKCEKCGANVPEDNDTGVGPVLCDLCINLDEKADNFIPFPEFDNLPKEKQDKFRKIADEIWNSASLQDALIEVEDRYANDYSSDEEENEEIELKEQEDRETEILIHVEKFLRFTGEEYSERDEQLIRTLVYEKLLEAEKIQESTAENKFPNYRK